MVPVFSGDSVGTADKGVQCVACNTALCTAASPCNVNAYYQQAAWLRLLGSNRFPKQLEGLHYTEAALESDISAVCVMARRKFLPMIAL